MSDDPQVPLERRLAARHLVQHPMTCKEHDADIYRLIRRHEAELDRWFTQRLGYRLHVDADSARLFKTGVVPDHRPLRTSSGRRFHQLEYVLLALVLASTAAGPAVISLRDLIDQVRSAAAEAGTDLADGTPERRALVTVLQWMIAHGLAAELHAHVDAYATDETADAVLKVRPDRIALLPLPALVRATNSEELLSRAERRSATRQWLRCRLVEDPVLYRQDLSESEWSELRRRQREEERILDEMFGLRLEVRAEGVAVIDPSGMLADRRFPTGGTLGHAALLLLETLRPATAGEESVVSSADIVAHITALAARHVRHWSKDLVDAPERLARQVVELLVDLRLAQRVPTASPTPADGDDGLRILPAAGRFLATTEAGEDPDDTQESLW